ncbi:triphosphoribosyl-dephospho-CoA synthase [Methanothermococcus sp. SCGC AD-155-N22]|nr:triphosphoribosyl-dephospho-CoA synthase [Methanothermococcus sp. SCGC AD-155-N22]
MDPWDIMKSSQIACVLEVSSFKPGNVHRYRDFSDIKYHHFLTSGIAFGDVIYKAAQDSKNIGKYIKMAVIQSRRWSPSNANLGIIMLHVPIAMGAGNIDNFDSSKLRKEMIRLSKNTTVEDSLNVYDAISIAMPNLNPPKRGPDVKEEDAKKRLIEENLTLYHVFKISSEWDNISKEWTEGFKISFEGYELLKDYYLEERDINWAITKTYIYLLSKYPDTLIARKNNLEISKEVSKIAMEIRNNGYKKEDIEKFDSYLSKDGNRLNPGTTADIVAASLMIFLLDRINSKDTILW